MYSKAGSLDSALTAYTEADMWQQAICVLKQQGQDTTTWARKMAGQTNIYAYMLENK